MIQSIAEQFERLPPHDLDMEMCLLASMMLGAPHAEVAQTIAEVPESAFFQTDHQIVYRALCDMHRAGVPIDAVLLRAHLRDKNLLEEIGGSAYISQIVGTVGNYARIKHYSAGVCGKWQLREAIKAANDILRAAYDPLKSQDVQALLLNAANSLMLTAATGRSDSIVTLAAAVSSLMERLYGKQALFVPTGLDDLDKLIIGMPIGGLTLIGADSRTGKSLVMKDIARRLALAGKRTGIIAMEETEGKIAANMLAANSNVESRDIMRGQMTSEDWTRLQESVDPVSAWNIFIETSAQTITDIEAAVSLMVHKHKCEAIMIDHFHLIDIGDARNETSVQSSICHRIKHAFKRANVAGVLATQVNKSQNLNERPHERSIRGTNVQFNDADLVILLYCSDFANEGQPNFTPNNLIELIVKKNKYGPTATAVYEIDRPHQKLKDRTQEENIP